MFERFDHPYLASVALAGAGWWVIGLVLGTAGPESLGFLSTVLHLLGLVTLVVVGIVYAIIWWGRWLQTWLNGKLE